jgi:hypothetical protein
MSSKLAMGMENALKKRIEEIKQLPFLEIKGMPSYSDEEVEINNKLCTLAIWKNQRDDGMIEVVVQVYYTGLAYRLFGAGMMTADGFLLSDAGRFLKLPEEVRLKYR